MWRIGVMTMVAGAVWGQGPAAPKPFQANAKLGVPAFVGYETTVIGTTEKVETATLRELTLESAEFALVFPNRAENVVAASGEKLLILRGSIRNPEKTTELHLGPNDAVGLRLWQKYAGTGQFKFVGHFDPQTMVRISKGLRPDESAKFIGVWRVPADLSDYRFGLYYSRPVKVAWYDLAPDIGKMRSIFATADGLGTVATASVGAGTAFEMDGLEIRVGGVTTPRSIGGVARDPAKPLYVVDLTVANRLMLPARWGWQYMTVELVSTDKSAVKSYPDIIDRATDRSWSGDLNAEASMTAQFLFYPETPKVGRVLRVTMVGSGRVVEVALGR